MSVWPSFFKTMPAVIFCSLIYFALDADLFFFDEELERLQLMVALKMTFYKIKWKH
jgi:hypothetical protein